MKTLIAAILATVALTAQAADFVPTHLTVHIASVHTQGGYNNTNPGVGLRWADASGDGPVVGVYFNSERSTSVYAGYAWNWPIAGALSAQITVGAVTGFKRAPVVPMVMPSLAYARDKKTALRLSAIPPVGKMAGVVHLTYDVKF